MHSFVVGGAQVRARYVAAVTGGLAGSPVPFPGFDAKRARQVSASPVGVTREGRAGVRRAYSRGLATQTELLDQRLVSFVILAFEVGKQALPLAHHDEQTAPSVVVLAVFLEVLGQLLDPGGEQGDLDSGGAGVVGVRTVRFDDVAFGFSSEWHKFPFEEIWTESHRERWMSTKPTNAVV